MVKNLPKPCAILNIGGVNNITYIPTEFEIDMSAFDICFGNAPFDDLMAKFTDFDYDEDGEIALSGYVDQEICDKILKNGFIDRRQNHLTEMIFIKFQVKFKKHHFLMLWLVYLIFMPMQ